MKMLLNMLIVLPRVARVVKNKLKWEVADKVNQPGKPVKEIFPDVQVCATHEICDYQSSSETAHVCKWSS